MKMTYRNILKKGILFCLMISVFSCSDELQNGTFEKEAVKSDDKNTYLVITDADISSARGVSTINPVITDDDIQGIINRLTDFQLKGTPPGYSDVMTIAKASSYEELLRLQVPLTAGDWRNVSLTADLDIGTTSSYSITYSETKSGTVTVEPGKVNPVSFSLKTSSNGGLNITMNFAGDADSVRVSVKSSTHSPLSYDSSKTKTYTDFVTKESEGKVYKSFTYSLQRTEMYQSLSAGTYYLLFEFYKDGISEPINNPAYFVNVESGFITTAELSVDLNEVYIIDYKFFTGNEEELAAEGSFLPEGITLAEGSVLPANVYFRKSAFTLPQLEKDGCIFDGWYTSTDFTEDSRITVIPKGSTGRKILYARFLQVPATSYTELPTDTNGTIGTTGTYVLFGDWPQTIKASTVTVDETKSIQRGAYTYYYGSDDSWYAKSTEDAYNSDYTYSDGTSVGQGNVDEKYFKVEPIKWRVLTTDYNRTMKKMLLAESILINCKYYDYKNIDDSYNRIINDKTVYPNNYKHSRLRAYLNGLNYQVKAGDSLQIENTEFLDKGFLQTAFSTLIQANISVTDVDNSVNSNFSFEFSNTDPDVRDCTCENTLDKIFCISESEAMDTTYGFGTHNSYITERLRKPTDFAKANGISENGTSEKNGSYWLRSPALDYSDGVHCCDYNGRSVIDDGDVSLSDIGVVPALCLE